MDSKRCIWCDTEYPLTEEFWCPRGPGKWYAHCRACNRGRNREYSQRPEVKERRREYYQRPEVKERQREYGQRPESKERQREYRQRPESKELLRVLEHRRQSRIRALKATFTVRDWERALDYFGERCAVCGRPRGLWHTLAQDHWVPLIRGGSYTPDNIVPLCHGDGGCNNHKRDRDAHQWLVETLGPRKAAKVERRINDYFQWVREVTDGEVRGQGHQEKTERLPVRPGEPQ